MLGTWGSGVLLKLTFAGHFTGGETAEDVEAVTRKLDSNGIGAILDYAAEGLSLSLSLPLRVLV
jgi:hypothetical protein